MDELSRLRGNEGIRACDDASHTVASREKIYFFPAASHTVVSHSSDVPSPETPCHRKFANNNQYLLLTNGRLTDIIIV